MSRPKLTLEIPHLHNDTTNTYQQCTQNKQHYICPTHTHYTTEHSYKVDNISNIFINNNLNLYITSNGIQYNNTQDPTQLSISDFQLLDIIGTGASSTVYKAIYNKLNMYVAIKQLNIYDTNARHQLYKELHTLHSIHKQQSVQQYNTLLLFYGCYYQSSIFSLILEYMDVGSIDTMLNKLPNRCITDYAVISYITRQILTSLYILRQQHQLHRDIKPQNILINSSGHVKLSDFGLTRQLLDDTLQQCHTYVGTLVYMAPERITGNKYSYSSDIWSIGLIVYLITTGIHPYVQQRTVLQQRNSDTGGQIGLIQSIVNDSEPRLDCSVYDSDLCDFVSTCVVKEPKQRASAEQLLQHAFVQKYAAYSAEQFAGWLRFNYLVPNTG